MTQGWQHIGDTQPCCCQCNWATMTTSLQAFEQMRLQVHLLISVKKIITKITKKSYFYRMTESILVQTPKVSIQSVKDDTFKIASKQQKRKICKRELKFHKAKRLKYTNCSKCNKYTWCAEFTIKRNRGTEAAVRRVTVH